MKSSFDHPVARKARSFFAGHLLSSALLMVAAGCTGQIGESTAGRPGGPSSRTTGPGTTSTATGTTGTTATTGGATPVDPGTKGVHRLNSNEYNATVADVLGTKLQPADSSWRGGEIGGFDNIASVLDVDQEQVQRYFDTAGLIADDVFASAPLKAKVVTCATADD